MPPFSRSDLLSFLSEPRCLKEVAEHFEISSPVAYCVLQEALVQNQILVCKCSRNPSLKSQKKQKQRDTLFYIAEDSGLLSKGLTRFAAKGVRLAQEGVRSETAFVKFRSKVSSKSNFFSMIENTSDSGNRELGQTPFPRVRVNKGKLVRSARLRAPPVIRQSLTQSQIGSFSVAEKLSMLTALSRQPLSYLDLRARFSISKKRIKTFMKNGLIKEVWGPKNIGVRFRLTENGKKHLKRLKVAAKFGKDKMRKTTIELGHSRL